MAELMLLQNCLENLDEENVDDNMQNLRRRYYQRRRQNRFFALQFLESFATRAHQERRMWTKIRSSDWWDNIVLGTYSESDFKEEFRVSKSTFNYLCWKLKPVLEKKGFRKVVTVEKRVAVTLLKLASCGELKTVANLMGIGKSTTCVIMQEVCSAICEAFAIRFPTGAKLQKNAEDFLNKGSLIGCVGAIDGSHIPIKAPAQNAKDFFCRKQYFSIVLQGVVDASVSFISVNVGWPGSVHDARVFRNSKLYSAGVAGTLFRPQTISIQNTQVSPFLLGDKAYPELSWLKKPNAGILNANMLAYNKKISTGRICAEHAFGQLKGRWRCLLKENDADIDNLKTQVLACCILHNICKSVDDIFIHEWSTNNEVPVTYDFEVSSDDDDDN